MKSFVTLAILCSAASVAAFPTFTPDFHQNVARTMEMIKRDPELSALIRDIYIQQKREEADFYADVTKRGTDYAEEEAPSRRTTNSSTNCLSHPLQDFYPATVAGLKRFPEAAYPYQDPKPSDQRGVCPGLNAMANHGYIPRSGIATLAQTIKGAAQLFNMGADLTAFLAGGSVLLAGDIPTMTYSIGGADARTNSLGVVGGALGTETGLSGHLRFVVFSRVLRLHADLFALSFKEGDASGTRCDFYLCNGDNHNLNATIFLNLQSHAKKEGHGQYNVEALTAHFKDQYLLSRNSNPYFYFLPQQAGKSSSFCYQAWAC
jgi:hypothetical protein